MSKCYSNAALLLFCVLAFPPLASCIHFASATIGFFSHPILSLQLRCVHCERVESTGSGLLRMGHTRLKQCV
ncbi:hypothetical protein V8E53_000562 [Lactarius tabidus]